MKTIQTRFGELEYDAEKTINFVSGPLGFESLREFVVVPQQKEGPLFWIQSTEDAQVAFILTDPANFFLDYRVVPDAGERAKLGIGLDEECFTLVVVTVPPDRKVTLNLMAPILFAPKTQRAMQVVLENSPYCTRHPLPGA